MISPRNEVCSNNNDSDVDVDSEVGCNGDTIASMILNVVMCRDTSLRARGNNTACGHVDVWCEVVSIIGMCNIYWFTVETVV